MMRPANERGVALVAALLVMTMMSGMLAGFLVMVNADQTAGGIERDQTQAYAAAHAGVEKLTADLGQLFAGNFSPTGAQLANLTTNAMEPNLQGIDYIRPDGTSGYRINFEDLAPADGNPDVEEPTGSPINAGPFQGLRGLITPYTIEVTSRTAGNAEVRMRRTMQTIAIPVFQFGIFSENDLSFFAGPNFAFGGKVHTNQNLFLKQDGGGTLTLQDRVTAVGEVVRNRLSNGVISHNGTVRVARNAGCPAAPAGINLNCFVLANNQGSVVDSLGSADNEPTWTNVSIGTSGGWLRSGRTGARRLDLPIVSDGATPVDLIRRPPVGEALNTAVARQRFYNMATLRILLSDTADDLTGLPGVDISNGGPMRLAGALVPAGIPNAVPGTPAFAQSTGVLGDGFRTHDGVPSIDGFILINLQDRDGNWTNVTQEIMSLGFIGRRLSNGTIDVADLNNQCINPHPNAVIRVQRVRDNITNGSNGCNGTVATNNGDNFWPNVLYDAREGMLRDDQGARPQAPGSSLPPGVAGGQPRMFWGGVMHYVELDVRNLRRWMRSEIGTAGRAGCINGAGGANCPMDVTGYVLYFSDRRGNRNRGGDGAVETNYGAGGWVYADDQETGEFGFEDIINPGTATSAPNGALDAPYTDVNGDAWFSEDVNFSGTLETYGGDARLLPADAGIGTLTMRNHPGGNYTPASNQYFLYANPIDRNVARVNRAFFFRRALKLVNGGRGDLPANGTQGLTVASENAVYVQGNYNACVTSTTVPTQANWSPACTGGVGFGNAPGNDHVSAAIVADAVTFLSNAWNDIRSFVNPYNAGITDPNNQDGQGKYNAREGRTTWYRVGLIAGKTLSFARPTNNGNDHTDFGTDGGAHNFIRYLENWDGSLNYRGSLISFYTSRQGIGTYKCCDIVYGPPTRGYNFDTDFLLPNLLPPRTPMFRDLNTLTFRQILRPTQ